MTVKTSFCMSEQGRKRTQWVAEQLTQFQRDFLSELPMTVTIPIDGLGDILFFVMLHQEVMKKYLHRLPRRKSSIIFFF